MMHKSTEEAFLVTGALGCIGAWTLFHLVDQNKKVIALDISQDYHRVDLLLDSKQKRKVTFVQADLADFTSVINAFQDHSVTNVIHLAALQVPFCKADPVKGAQVNVVGTVNIFEAAKQAGLRHVSYASSIAVYGPPSEYSDELIPHDASFDPRTLYGVYKVANEGTAFVYWQDHKLSSIALRPFIVYGPGRDQGLTSDPTKAMKAAARAEAYQINFSGKYQYHYASDVAKQFIEASRSTRPGAQAFNLGGRSVEMEELVNLILATKPEAQITYPDHTLPFPVCSGNEFEQQFSHLSTTPLHEGIRETIRFFERATQNNQDSI